MNRNALLIVAALLIPTAAHAEFATPRDSVEVRPAPKRAKPERALARVALTARDEAKVVPRLTVEDVLTKINTIYMSGLQRCYRKSLAADPTLSGKVTLSFEVAPDGTVTSKLEGLDAKTDRCMSTFIAGWRFAAPQSRKDASFRISLMLQGS